jgi:hypothetical protein
MDPRLHDSYGYNDCSPQGFVALRGPSFALMHGLYLFILSKKITPGSALFHALKETRSIS